MLWWVFRGLMSHLKPLIEARDHIGSGRRVPWAQPDGPPGSFTGRRGCRAEGVFGTRGLWACHVEKTGEAWGPPDSDPRQRVTMDDRVAFWFCSDLFKTLVMFDT